MLHINTLDKVREEWQSEHIKACEVPGTRRAGLPSSTSVELLEGKLERNCGSLLKDSFLLYFLNSTI